MLIVDPTDEKKPLALLENDGRGEMRDRRFRTFSSMEPSVEYFKVPEECNM